MPRFSISEPLLHSTLETQRRWRIPSHRRVELHCAFYTVSEVEQFKLLGERVGDSHMYIYIYLYHHSTSRLPNFKYCVVYSMTCFLQSIPTICAVASTPATGTLASTLLLFSTRRYLSHCSRIRSCPTFFSN